MDLSDNLNGFEKDCYFYTTNNEYSEESDNFGQNYLNEMSEWNNYKSAENHRKKLKSPSTTSYYGSEPSSIQQLKKPRRRLEYHLTVELRNARERNRVRAVNEAFNTLRKIIPYTAYRNKRVSKVKTLQKAVQYIAELTALLKSENFK